MSPPNQPQTEPAHPPKREQPLMVPTVGLGKDQVSRLYLLVINISRQLVFV